MERKTFKYPLFRMFLVLSESETWWFVSETFKKQIHRSKKKKDVCERNEKKTNYLFKRMFFFYLRARVFIIIF